VEETGSLAFTALFVEAKGIVCIAHRNRGQNIYIATDGLSLRIGPFIMIQTLPLPSLRAIEGVGSSDVRITLDRTIS
jgi:hypothetical protein